MRSDHVPFDGASVRYRAGVDVGGTFTDVCLYDADSGRSWTHKVPSTPHDPSLGIASGLSELASRSGVDPGRIGHVAQGSTIAINAMLQGLTGKVGLITTDGFRDLLEIRRQRRDVLYDLFWRKPEPLIPRYLRLEVPERLDSNGEVLVPLDEACVTDTLRALSREKVDAIVVCFLFSYLNPAHEIRVAELARDLMPDTPVWPSHAVLPEFREFERLSTTVCNAALSPVMSTYLSSAGSRLIGAGFPREPYVMQSNGGVTSPDGAAAQPASTLFSGPSAGVVGALKVATSTGTDSVITLDMGGTSTDVCLIDRGAVSMVNEKEIAGLPVRTRMVDVNSVGAGGGSIAWIDAGGRLKVGPRSAGAEPGPAAYGRGGGDPTVTDANLVLGRIGPAGLLGGGMPLDLEAARAAIESGVARPLGLGLTAAALGILRVVNTNIVLAARVVSVQRGYDPRQFGMVALGGAGPLHASAVARELGAKQVVVPPSPGIACALGMLSTDMRADYVQTCLETFPDGNLDRVNATLEGLEARARRWLESEDVRDEERSIVAPADLRYAGQNYELTVSASPSPWDSGTVEQLCERFHGDHLRRNGYRADDLPIQLVNLRVTATAEMPKLEPRTAGDDDNRPGRRRGDGQYDASVTR